MAKYYYHILTMPTAELIYATDMLRYDQCYEIEYRTGQDHATVYCLQFTPDRWASFGVRFRPTQIVKMDMTAAEYNAAAANAHGFVEGVRFAQKWIGNHYQMGRIVEDHG